VTDNSPLSSSSSSFFPFLGDFDPAKFDAAMAKAFGDDYYGQVDPIGLGSCLKKNAGSQHICIVCLIPWPILSNTEFKQPRASPKTTSFFTHLRR
jgi:hypothetical protein